MWESRRDFQRVWEGWEAGFMAFHAFHTLSFPWPALGRETELQFRQPLFGESTKGSVSIHFRQVDFSRPNIILESAVRLHSLFMKSLRPSRAGISSLHVLVPTVGNVVTGCVAYLILLVIPSPLSAQTFEQIHQVVQFYGSHDNFSGNVVVFQNGQIVSNESRGLANQEWKIANTASTRFAIGSITKQFTATAILLLQEQGRLKTSDSVSKYYDQAPAGWKSVTLRELLLHTSGIPDDLFSHGSIGFEQGQHSPQEAVEDALHKPLAFPPGTRTAYTNVEYVLLGLIIERVSGQNYADFLRTHFFVPLEMHDTGVGWVPHVIPQRASGYSSSDAHAQEAERFSVTALSAAGAMYSTGADLARWLLALHSGRVLKPDSYAEMIAADADGFGYGLNISTQYGLQDIGHAGDLPGFHVSTEYFPARKTGIVVLTNIVSAGLTPGTYAIANDLMQLVSDRNAIVRSTGREAPLNGSLLQTYVGRYTNTAGQQIDVLRVGDHLTLKPLSPGKEESTLRAESANRFYCAEWDGEAEFSRDDRGTVRLVVFAYTNESATLWTKQP